MAEGQKIGGYQCEFVGPVPEELLCKSCKLVAREPHITGCCEVRFCHACIDPVLKDKKPCPSCGEVDLFSTVFTNASQKKILALQVRCAMKQKGCEWVGQLEQLDAHLDTDCQYVDVECPSKCDKKVQKRNLATHLEMDCHKREFMCPYCTYKDTFEIVSNVHWPECLLFPLKCPNRCGVTCEREFIDDHMQLCSLEEVECEVSFAGCKEKFLRQDQDEHMKRNVERHLNLTATETLRNKQELQEKDAELQKQEEKLKQNLEEKDQQIRELQESHKQVQQQLQEKDAELKQELTKRDTEMKQELQKKDEAIKALKDDMKQELKKRDDELKLKDTELKEKLETTDRNIRKVIEEQNKRLQEQLKARDSEVTKKQQTKDKQFEQKLREKGDKLKQELQKKDEAMKALKDDMNRELKKRDDELKLKDTELKEKLETTDRNIRKDIEEQNKRLQEQLKARDSEVTKKQQTKDKQFEQKLQEKGDKLKQEMTKRDAELKQELQKKDEVMKALKDDMNRELKKRDDELKLKLEEKDQQVRESAAEVTALKKQLQETDQKFNTLSTTCLPTYHLTMANYAELKGKSTHWDSERFYTHPGGYKCFIRVWPNGLCGTHVAVQLCSVPGQFDGTLPWPAKATFTLQLLNQHRDQDHVTVTKRIEWGKPSGAPYAGTFSDTFIPHAELGWNAGKQTKYLHEDCLRFRMAKIELHK